MFLRYNPDAFKTNKQRKDPAHSTRMKHLQQVLRYALQLTPEELVGFCSVRRLYFDGWEPTRAEYGVVLEWQDGPPPPL